MLLTGSEPANRYKLQLQEFFQQKKLTGKYVGIIFLGTNAPSRVYVSMKQKFGQDIGLSVRVFGQEDAPLLDVTAVLRQIVTLNADVDCLGILVQLPVPTLFAPDLPRILAAVAPAKDIDGLGGVAFGLATVGVFAFLPATPAAVMHLLRRYQLDAVQAKNIVILGQSNLIGKPLAHALLTKQATVFSCNAYTDVTLVKKMCQNADYIVSCTGVMQLIDETYVRTDQSQIIIDVGWGLQGKKAMGDVMREKLEPLVQAITPVPGGVGPMTIASLFRNVKVLWEAREKF